MTNPRHQSSYRWIIIALCALTAICVIAVPMMSLPVLFDQIAVDLDLTLIQIGFIWSISSLTGMFIGLLGGILGDRYGSRRLLIVACIGVGLMGASRGLATNFVSFTLASFALGLFAPLIGVNVHNVAGQWFARQQLGLANGIISSGFAAGFLLGSLFAANTIAPFFGGWRPTMYGYGGLAFLVAGAWWWLVPENSAENPTHTHIPLREGLPKVLTIRTVWLIGLGKIGVWGCVRGFTGYLPLYLRGLGWDPNSADAALSAFFVVSLLGAIPIPMLSDRLGKRKQFLVAAACLIGGGSLLVGAADGALIFLGAMIAGILFDAFMGLSITLINEIETLDRALVGTALGAVFFFSDIGGTIAPPLGNALAGISPELPFFLWGAMAILASVAFNAVRETD
ncbi:MAG: MFS transporter [Candidatus Promineifilaceae bacterium]